MTKWYSVEDADAQERLLLAWPGAPLSNLNVCEMLLATAREQVIAYAPASAGLVVEDGYIVDPEGVPSRYVYAQLQQATNLWNASRADTTGDIGPDSYSFTPRPLDKTIRQIIRPVDGKPHVL